MIILNTVEEVLDYFEHISDYDAGFNDGAADANILAQPRDTNRHTRKAYEAIRERAERIYSRVEDEGREAAPYFRGYCDGADEVALCVRGDVANMALQLKGV